LLLKGRFQGGSVGWIERNDLELFAGVSMRPLKKPTPRQTEILELINREGPMDIDVMKEMTGLLSKEITPVLHRLQKAFLVYEDQYDGQWDRGWYAFSEMFPGVDLEKYSRNAALKVVLCRFAYRHVIFDQKMVKSFYKAPVRDIKRAVEDLISSDILVECDEGYLLSEDNNLLKTYNAEPPQSVYAMHRNDFLVKSNEHWLKERFVHSYPDTLYYLLIDGEFKGVVAGKFRYTPDEIEDVQLDLPIEEASARSKEILHAVHMLCGADNEIKRYCGNSMRDS